MHKKLLLIVNPVAGTMKAKNALFTITNIFCKADYLVTTLITKHRGHACDIAKSHSHEYDLVVCCGGDGTLNEVISGVLASGIQTPIGYIPAGSTNDFASTMGLVSNPSKAAEIIVEGKPHNIDIGLFGNTYFSYIASFGAFTAASYSASQEMKNVIGHMAYIFEGIKELPTIHPTHVKVTTSDSIHEDDYIFGSITNSTSVAGIVKLKSDIVDLSDGVFEVILVKNPKTIAHLNKIIHSISTSDFNNDMFEFFKASELTVCMDEPISWTLDGEHMPEIKEISIQNLHGVISLIK